MLVIEVVDWCRQWFRDRPRGWFGDSPRDWLVHCLGGKPGGGSGKPLFGHLDLLAADLTQDNDEQGQGDDDVESKFHFSDQFCRCRAKTAVAFKMTGSYVVLPAR